MKKILRKNNIILCIIILLLTSIIFFANNNYKYYEKTIVKITHVNNKKVDVNTNQLGFKEQYYEQKITGIIKNGKNKGKEINLENNYSHSLVVTEKYGKSDEVFVKNNNIIGLKRDKYIVLLISAFILLIYAIGKFRGLYTIFSVIFNLFIFYIGLYLYSKGINLLLLCMIELLFLLFHHCYLQMDITEKLSLLYFQFSYLCLYCLL